MRPELGLAAKPPAGRRADKARGAVRTSEGASPSVPTSGGLKGRSVLSDRDVHVGYVYQGDAGGKGLVYAL